MCLRLLIHLGFILRCGVRYGSNFIFCQMITNLSQLHLLKYPSLPLWFPDLRLWVQGIHWGWSRPHSLPSTTTKVPDLQKEGGAAHTSRCLYRQLRQTGPGVLAQKAFQSQVPRCLLRAALQAGPSKAQACPADSPCTRWCCFLTLCSLFQFEPQLHRSDRVSLHVALLLPAHLLWRNADNRQCHDPQWHGRHRKNCRQGEIALWLVVNLDLAQTFVP